MLVTALFASVALGQRLAEVNRVFHFAHTEAAQDLQAIAALIRSITEMRQVSADTAQRSLAVRGAAEQIELAEWLFHELDGPDRQNSSPREYRLSGGADNLVRVFYLAHAEKAQEVQEVATLLRSMTDIRRLFTYMSPRALAVRGTADQIALAEWLIGEIYRLPQDGQAAPREYRMPRSADDVSRVFHLAHAKTPRDLQEVATLVRTTADVDRVLTCTGPRIVAARGTSGQIALAAWLLSELDRPATRNRAAQEYRFSSSMDNATVVRVSYLARADSAQRLQEIAAQVRSATGIRRLWAYTTSGALVLRGTADQIAAADRMIGEQDR